MNQLLSIVFVIDDDHSVRRALRRLIRSVGLQFELFGSAFEFLEREHPDTPSCMILDIRLPGMRGLGLQRRLAEAKIHIPILFIPATGISR
jgi:FixJ family two-component response regulator